MLYLYLGVGLGLLVSTFIEDEGAFSYKEFKKCKEDFNVPITILFTILLWPIILIVYLFNTLVPYYEKWEERYNTLNKIINEYKCETTDEKNNKRYKINESKCNEILELFNNKGLNVRNLNCIQYKIYNFTLDQFIAYYTYIDKEIDIKEFMFVFKENYLHYEGHWKICEVSLHRPTKEITLEEFINMFNESTDESECLYIDLVHLFKEQNWIIMDCEYVFLHNNRISLENFIEWSKEIKWPIVDFTFQFEDHTMEYNGRWTRIPHHCGILHEVKTFEEFKNLIESKIMM